MDWWIKNHTCSKEDLIDLKEYLDDFALYYIRESVENDIERLIKNTRTDDEQNIYDSIKRLDYSTKEYSQFVKCGIWANGQYAYSKLNEDGKVDNDNEGTYYQRRVNGKLVMFHI